ncbi:3,4-dihydroxy-2-butanone-4-phosphate synthase [Mycobacterium sp. NS-7484]|uniref:3,4-dihydroxy-2-butanone-4-phosphate synthase n=1 Tax=Mycobacterium sp. NS-7484 TaxID=1834161 RepID=UPI001301278A|nr:3,4-dihydroxy-2-butanone-4-phosphate synthase [Mycobacterium sp. NS-7484]
MLATELDEPTPVSELGAERIHRACHAMAAGEPVVLSDGAESSLALLSSAATPVGLSRLVKSGSGLLFVAVERERLRQLRIPPMAGDHRSPNSRFHVAVDAAVGIGTGISAIDRARTVRLLSDADCGTDDFVRPGHVIPVAADMTPPQAPGTPELAFALARLATDGVPAAAYCALTSERDPRSVAGPEEGAAIARQNGLAFILREDVLAAFYRAR